MVISFLKYRSVRFKASVPMDGNFWMAGSIDLNVRVYGVMYLIE